MATTRSTSRSTSLIRRLTWLPTSNPSSAMAVTACGVAGFCDQPRVPADPTRASTPASASRARRITSAIGERQMFPVQTTSTFNSGMSSALHAVRRIPRSCGSRVPHTDRWARLIANSVDIRGAEICPDHLME